MVWLASGIHQFPIQSNSWPPTASHHSDLIITTNISNKQEAGYCPIPPLDVSQHNVDIVYTLPTVQLYTLSRDSTALQAENTTQLHDNKWSHTGFEHEWSLKWGGAISLKYTRKLTHLTNTSIFNVLTSWYTIGTNGIFSVCGIIDALCWLSHKHILAPTSSYSCHCFEELQKVISNKS